MKLLDDERRSSGLSHQAVADRIMGPHGSVTKQVVMKWLSGRQEEMKVSSMLRLAEAFGYDLEFHLVPLDDAA